MRAKRLSARLKIALAAFAVTLLGTSTWAASQEKVLYDFNNYAGDGVAPDGGLIFDPAGNLYGATAGGGTYGFGTVFALTPIAGGGWTEKVLWNFGIGSDGKNPGGGLIFDAAGNLYGASGGGTYGFGTVFELSPDGSGSWTEKVLWDFGKGKDGKNIHGGLIFDAVGNLYGTTAAGGGHHFGGTVFELTPNAGGGWTEKILHNFSHNGKDGYEPFASLIFDAAGNLYGTTAYGGAAGCDRVGCGIVFELTPKAGGGWTETILHNFNNNGKDGLHPYDGLIFDAAGNLYGTTRQGGGPYSIGAVFELTRKAGGGWAEKVLHRFKGGGQAGLSPNGVLIFDPAGNLYGATAGGGTYGNGTVFELTPIAGESWTEKVLWNFGSGSDGKNPDGGLIFDAAGNLYGTTSGGGAHNSGGTAFEITP
jgi:uncharacterized repeat protein (TIGR03803 family)